MATRKPPEGTVRTNVHINKENYELFKKLSKAVNYTFTDLVNEALVQFNNSIKVALETGDIQALIELYDKQISDAKKQLEEYKNTEK